VAQWELFSLNKALTQLSAFARKQSIDSEIVERLRRAWPIAYFPSALLFAAFANFCFVVYRSYVADDFLILDGTPAFYLTLTILTITGFITGIGVGGVIFAIWSLGRVFREELEWQPFHSDQRGGYGFLATFSVETAILFSFGSVLVPAAVTIGYDVGWPVNITIYGVTIFYALLILLIFAWPVSALSLNADRCRRRYLEDYSDGISYAISHSRRIRPVDGERALALADIELAASHVAPAEKLIYMFDKIASRSILPFRLNLLARVLLASAAPIILMIVQIFVERALK
jgi:hypothetical protein